MNKHNHKAMTDEALRIQRLYLDNHQGSVYLAMQSLVVQYGYKEGEQPIDDFDLLTLTNAYEAGFGKGQDGHQCVNPYKDGSNGYRAWAIGYELGQERRPQPEVHYIYDETPYLEERLAKASRARAVLSKTTGENHE